MSPSFAQSAAPGSENALQEVVVTGSRVIKNGDNSPSPVTVVSTEDLQQINPGAMLADSLNQLPALAGSRGATSNPTTAGSAAGGNGPANQLNLRNLGATRGLVLMDGKRVAPTLYNGVVDVDIIPQLLVERVDIVTGGVSAVYGSDAVSGVVNYVVNHKFDGFTANVNGGISARSDDRKTDLAFAYGTELGSNAHLEFSYERHSEGGIDNRTDRTWATQWGVTGAGTKANPYVLQSNLRQSSFPFGGLITSGALSGQEFTSNGVLSPFTKGVATGTSGVQVGGGGGYWDGSLVSPLTANQLFGRLDADLPANIHGYLQVSGDLKTNKDWAETDQLSGVTFSRGNAFLPAADLALIPASQASFTYSQLLGEIPRVEAISDSHQWVGAGGLDGTIGSYKWNVDFSHSDSTLKTQLLNALNHQKLDYALDAVNSGGTPVCNVTLTNPGLASGCVPFDAFGPTAASSGAINYVTDTLNYNAETTMDDVSGALTGSPVSTWAGPVEAALSAEWRKTSFTSGTTAPTTALVNCTGIRYGCTATSALYDYSFPQNSTAVSQSVWEVAGEFDAPILKDLLAVKSFNVNGAARYTDYDTSGTYWTWKLGADWHIDDALSLRGTRSRDIRAPNLYELDAPQSIVPVRPTDFLTGASPSVPSINISNPNLKAEIGDTETAGVVWKPVPKLSFAVDYYHINISQAITAVDGSTAAAQQACYSSGGTSPYCALQIRPFGLTNTSTANQVTGWIVKEMNISQVKTWGLDFEANYRTDLFSRPLNLRFLGEWQPHVYYAQPGTPTIDQGGVAFGPLGLGSTPAVRLLGFVRYQPVEHLTVDVSERWRSAMKLSGDPTQVWVNNHIDSFKTTALNVSWDQDVGFGNVRFYVNVQNLFDATPPPGAYYGNGTRAGLRDGFALGDDVIGRYFMSGVKMDF